MIKIQPLNIGPRTAFYTSQCSRSSRDDLGKKSMTSEKKNACSSCCTDFLVRFESREIFSAFEKLEKMVLKTDQSAYMILTDNFLTRMDLICPLERCRKRIGITLVAMKQAAKRFYQAVKASKWKTLSV